MIDTNALRAAWVKKGLTQEKVAEKLNITPKTMSLKMKKGVFGSDEIDKLVEILDISNPMSIFFASKVTR